MKTTAKHHRRAGSSALRLAGWLGVVAMLAIAVLGPSAASIAAAGPGAGDSLPNSGHTSNTGGVTPTMLKNATMTCNADSSVLNVSGQFTLSGTAGADTYVIIYLTPNNGSDASPEGNVENNEVKVDISGQSGTVDFSLNISSAFTTTKGGVLAVFAKDTDGSIFSSKSNSLNCTEGQETPPPTEPPATEPPATEPPATEPPATEPPATEPPATEPPATEPPATEPPATEPPATVPPTGEVEAATGTPRVTLPPTDTVGDQQQGTGTWRMLLIVMAGLLSGILALTPKRARR